MIDEITENESDNRRLRITEIFHSLQGESRSVGFPTIFIRLTGCPLRCGYCDTEYAFSGGQWMELDEIVHQVKLLSASYVTVTGGEPLAQKACIPLLTRLCDLGLEVSLETSGALDIGQVDTRVSRVMDLKTPGSGEMDKNRTENITLLTPNDQVKFVVADRRDFDWSCEQIKEKQLLERCEVLVSPVHGSLDADELAGWVIESGLPIRFQVQLHKLLWGDEPGR